MNERKLASVRKIDNITTIENADAIMCAHIGGWKVVVKKGDFNIGDLVVYFEIDSWIPHELAPFLSKGKDPREFNGVKGERLRTIKLRGQLSQGLLLPLQSEEREGTDLTDALNIQKWEMPMSAQLAGMAKGSFPSFIRKTDQERIQNLSNEFQEWKYKGLAFEVTEKCEGSSMTVYLNNGEFGVCSRNLDLKETEGNTFWQVAREVDLETKLRDFGVNLALQGELIGPGIQGNIYNLAKPEFRLFDIFNIDTQEYATMSDRSRIASALRVKEAPFIEVVCLFGFIDIDHMLCYAEDKSKLYDTEREGIVLKCLEDPSISFKAISNTYLMGE
jgi:RNA ligase (TIGR02306 family)